MSIITCIFGIRQAYFLSMTRRLIAQKLGKNASNLIVSHKTLLVVIDSHNSQSFTALRSQGASCNLIASHIC